MIFSEVGLLGLNSIFGSKKHLFSQLLTAGKVTDWLSQVSGFAFVPKFFFKSYVPTYLRVCRFLPGYHTRYLAWYRPGPGIQVVYQYQYTGTRFQNVFGSWRVTSKYEVPRLSKLHEDA